MFDTLGNQLIDLIHQVWYSGLFIASFLENLIPPIPSEVIMPLWWYLAATGKLNLIAVIFICAIGSTLGNIPYYFIGRFFNKGKIKNFVKKYGSYFFTKPEYIDDLYDIFEKNDRKIVFFGRFLPWARAFIGLPAGSIRMNFLQFTLYTFAGTLVWTVFLVFLGYWFGIQYDLVVKWLEEYKHIMYPLIVIGWLLFLGWIIVRKRDSIITDK
jgi:membrane protein DedA with SNARE-associated domain